MSTIELILLSLLLWSMLLTQYSVEKAKFLKKQNEVHVASINWLQKVYQTLFSSHRALSDRLIALEDKYKNHVKILEARQEKDAEEAAKRMYGCITKRSGANYFYYPSLERAMKLFKDLK